MATDESAELASAPPDDAVEHSPWYAVPFRFAESVIGHIVEAVRMVLAGEVNGPRLLLSGMVLLSILAVVVLVIQFIGQTENVAITFYVFVGAILLTFVISAIQHRSDPMHTPSGFKPSGGGALPGDIRAQLLSAQAGLGAWRGRMNEIMATCDQIFSQLETTKRFAVLVRDRTTVTVEENGNAAVEQEVTVSTTDDRIQMINCEFSGPPGPDYWGLRLTARSKDAGREVVALPAKDDHIKKAILFFLPVVPKDVSATYTLSWQWAGMWKPLLDTGTDFWELKVMSDEARMVEIRFRIHESLGPVALSNTGDAGGKDVTVRPVPVVNGFREYNWAAENVAKYSTLKIKLVREK